MYIGPKMWERGPRAPSHFGIEAFVHSCTFMYIELKPRWKSTSGLPLKTGKTTASGGTEFAQSMCLETLIT